MNTDMHSDDVKRLDRQLGCVVVSILAFTGCALLVFEAYTWLRLGKTQTVALLNFRPAPVTTWLGIQKIVDLLWRTPLWILFFVSVVLISWWDGLTDDK